MWEAMHLTVMIVFFVVFYYTGKRPELWQDVGLSAVLVYAGVVLGGLAGFVGITTATASSGTVLSSSLSFSFTVEDLPSLLVEATYGFGLLFGAAAIASTRILWPGGSIDNKASIRTAALASFLVFSSFIVTSIALWLFFQVQLPTGLLPIELAQLTGYLVLPILFLAVLYLSGRRAYLLNDYARLLAYLLVGCVVGSILGAFAQGYLESLVFSGFSLSSFVSWESLGFAVEQGVVASLLGFSAVYLGESRRRSSGMASISEFTTDDASSP
jgi:hypothetical protein